MKQEEVIAKKYLKELQVGSVEFEPDGNIPPDFKINNIGIEVRRLNQNYTSNHKTEGIEQKHSQMQKLFEQVYATFDKQYSGRSFWTSLRFCRPLEDKRVIRSYAKKSLQEFIDNPIPTPTTLEICNNVEMYLVEAENKFDKVFLTGSILDHDYNGFVNNIYIENIKLCISEKSKKIEKYKQKYQEWWLVLVDHIKLPISESNLKIWKQYLSNTEKFSKILIISEKDGELIFSFQNYL
ncbi:MAG: hypothetical protein HND52_13445 [Ignavibacteriae bacterium]|nr:hypothetical protein [Ignavibacteriota bacterium]NOG98958.1 hypothetical protein [Ignavibacteriota bacterium]